MNKLFYNYYNRVTNYLAMYTFYMGMQCELLYDFHVIQMPEK